MLLVMLTKNSMADSNPVLDKDHDNVPDHIDHCPDTPQLRKYNPLSKYAVLHSSAELSAESHSIAVDAKGCALDSDSDGVPDYKDFCPDDSELELSAGIHANGCPLQSDGDGTPDYRDKCSGTPRGVQTDRQGCPVSNTEAAFINANTS